MTARPPNHGNEPLVTVVIVAYDSQRDVPGLLMSLDKEGADIPLQVVVVDNCSRDGTVELVERDFPWVELVRSRENGGYGYGINRGLERAKGRYIFALNPDLAVRPGCCRELADFLTSHPDAGVVGPLVINDKGRGEVSFHPFLNLPLSLLWAFGLQRLLPLNRCEGRWELRRSAPDRPVRVDRLLGAAMMSRTDLAREVGGFDERFFLYSEEEDFCRRVSDAGWEVWFNPNKAAVEHRGAGSTGRYNPLAVASSNWSRYLYMRKHFTPLEAELSRTAWILGLLLRLCIALVLLPLLGFRRVKGYWLALRSLTGASYFERRLGPRSSSLQGKR